MEAAAQPVSVSAIVAAHNVAPYIADCVNSLLASEGCAVEVIVVDDASTDSTVEVVRELCGGDARVQVLRSDVNRGPSHARNLGMAVARGEWLALVDADDWCSEQRFSIVCQAAQRFGADMISDDQWLIEDGSRAPWSTINRVSHWRQDSRQPVAFEHFVRSRHIVKPLIKREFWQACGVRFHEEIRHGEDFLLFSELLLAGARWHMLPEAMYYYRSRAGALTNTGEFAGGYLRALELLRAHEKVASNALYAGLCEQALAQSRRQADVRTARKALRDRDLPRVRRLFGADASLLRAVLRHELSVAPLRVRRRLHRLRFG